MNLRRLVKAGRKARAAYILRYWFWFWLICFLPQLISPMDIFKNLISKAGSSKASTNNPNKAAYVTYIGDENEDEAKGVVGLAKGLLRAQSKYPLVVVIPRDEYKNKPDLSALSQITLCSFETIGISFPKPYFKLGLWNITGYDRMIYLNADVQVYGNIDSLMEGNLPEQVSCLAVTGCLCEQTVTETGSEQPNTYSLSDCPKCPNQVTEPGDLPSPLYFNLGLAIFKPHLNTYNNLLNAVNGLKDPKDPKDLEDRTGKLSSGPDKSKITNMLKVLSLKDYLILDTDHLTKYEPEKAKVVHYRAAELKPWKKENKLEEKGIKILGKKWLDIYNDKSLDGKGKK